MHDEHHDDRALDALLTDAARHYRVPPEPALDSIWARVEAQAFPPAAHRRPARAWRMMSAAIAASLVLGVTLGRLSARGSFPVASTPEVAAATGSPAGMRPAAASTGRLDNDPYQRTTEEFLGRTALLLASLPAESRRDGDHAQVAAQAAQLLGTTRLLLDSPAASDPRVRALLLDLELMLAQVARLRAPQRHEELVLINDALTMRDVVPRIRSVAAEISSGDY